MKTMYRIIGVILISLSFNAILNADPTGDLLDAALKGDLAKAEVAIKAGADVNGRTKDKVKSIKYPNETYEKGSNALYLACAENHLGLAKYLIQKGCDVNAQNEVGDTPLTDSADTGLFEIVKLLLENKARIDTTNNKGHGIAILSAYSGNLDLVQYLLEKKS